MKIPQLSVIDGGRDILEANLAKALFSEDAQEIEKQIALINAVSDKKP